jgi:hypothetical protein
MFKIFLFYTLICTVILTVVNPEVVVEQNIDEQAVTEDITEETGHLEGEHNAREHAGGHESWEPLIVLFVFVGLLSGSILRELNKKTKFPYTPMLIILGIVL